MKIVAVGANGMAGQRVVSEALDRGNDVTAGMRDPEKGTPAGVPTVAVDIDDPETIAHGAAGHDAAASAVGPSGDHDLDVVVRAARSLLAELPRAGVSRLVVAGGAESLQAGPGVRLAGIPQLLAALKPGGLAHAEALEVYRREGESVEWTDLTPPPFIGPGERTGRYSTGTDSALSVPGGTRHLRTEDLAVAIPDELERRRFMRRRFAVGPAEAGGGDSPDEPSAEASGPRPA